MKQNRISMMTVINTVKTITLMNIILAAAVIASYGWIVLVVYLVGAMLYFGMVLMSLNKLKTYFRG